MKGKAKTTEKKASRVDLPKKIPKVKTRSVKSEPTHKERFNQLLDDAVLGVKK